MDASRSSTSLIPEAGIWKISDDASSNLCSPFTNASPGLSASYRPFVLPVADDGLSRTYRFFSQEGQNQAFWKIEGPVNISFSNLLNPGESYIISPASADHSRSLISAQINGRVAHLSEFFRISPRLYIDAVESTPDAAGEEWIRVCAASDFNVPAAFRLTIRDANASDTVVPYSARFPGASWNFPETGRLNLTAGKCAIIVDPDYRGQSLPLQENDTSLWTIESTGAIGNGLGSGEGLLLSLDSQNGNEILASFGLPDSPLPFSIPSQTGQYVKRTGGTLDLPENYEVRP